MLKNKTTELLSEEDDDLTIENSLRSRSGYYQNSYSHIKEECDNDSYSNPSTYSQISKKKQQYLEQTIQDKQGVYKYDENPDQYKKARKRL